jgi:hypothetical protein
MDTHLSCLAIGDLGSFPCFYLLLYAGSLASAFCRERWMIQSDAKPTTESGESRFL